MARMYDRPAPRHRRHSNPDDSRTKWDNQPGSVQAAYEALMRASQMAQTAPCGPTYINLDAAIQE